MTEGEHKGFDEKVMNVKQEPEIIILAQEIHIDTDEPVDKLEPSNNLCDEKLSTMEGEIIEEENKEGSGVQDVKESTEVYEAVEEESNSVSLPTEKEDQKLATGKEPFIGEETIDDDKKSLEEKENSSDDQPVQNNSLGNINIENEVDNNQYTESKEVTNADDEKGSAKDTIEEIKNAECKERVAAKLDEVVEDLHNNQQEKAEETEKEDVVLKIEKEEPKDVKVNIEEVMIEDKKEAGTKAEYNKTAEQNELVLDIDLKGIYYFFKIFKKTVES